MPIRVLVCMNNIRPHTVWILVCVCRMVSVMILNTAAPMPNPDIDHDWENIGCRRVSSRIIMNTTTLFCRHPPGSRSHAIYMSPTLHIRNSFHTRNIYASVWWGEPKWLLRSRPSLVTGDCSAIAPQRFPPNNNGQCLGRETVVLPLRRGAARYSRLTLF